MKKFLLTVVMAISIYAFVPLVVHVQGIKDADNILKTKTLPPTGIDAKQSLPEVVGTVINVALSLVGLIFLILMVYAGYLWLTSRGEESDIEKSKEIVKSSIIGLVLVMSAYAITVLVTGYFNK